MTAAAPATYSVTATAPGLSADFVQSRRLLNDNFAEEADFAENSALALFTLPA